MATTWMDKAAKARKGPMTPHEKKIRALARALAALGIDPGPATVTRETYLGIPFRPDTDQDADRAFGRASAEAEALGTAVTRALLGR